MGPGRGNRTGKALSPIEGVRLAKSIQREIDAKKMYVAGASYTDIAKALGFSHRSGARKAVMRGLAREYEASTESVRVFIHEGSKADLLECSQIIASHGPVARGNPEKGIPGSAKAALVVDRAIRTKDQIRQTIGRLHGAFQDSLTLTGPSAGPLDGKAEQDELLARIAGVAGAADAGAAGGTGPGPTAEAEAGSPLPLAPVGEAGPDRPVR
jgi:hypothetical protein